MSTNTPSYGRRGADVRMNTADLTVGQQLIRVITRRPTWGNGPIVRREVPVTIEKITKTRLVVKTEQGTTYRVLVENGDWNRGNVRDRLEGQSTELWSLREEFALYTTDDIDLVNDRRAVAKHNAKAAPELEAKTAVGAVSKQLTKETAEDAIKALQAYVASLDD